MPNVALSTFISESIWSWVSLQLQLLCFIAALLFWGPIPGCFPSIKMWNVKPDRSPGIHLRLIVKCERWKLDRSARIPISILSVLISVHCTNQVEVNGWNGRNVICVQPAEGSARILFSILRVLVKSAKDWSIHPSGSQRHFSNFVPNWS